MYVNGDQYIGEWDSGHQHGRGTLRYSHGDVYEGSFYHGFIYGYGKMKYADGGSYDGEFKNVKMNEKTGIEQPDPDGKRHGVGIRVWTNGNKYVGEWQSDKMNGKGTLSTLEGAVYSGMFWNGMKHSDATETFGNNIGIRYECPMGRRHSGMGFCTYKGGYKCGFFHGRGEFVCIDGRKYEGEWLKGKRHGKGRQFFLREGEIGDPYRLFIGGKGSLYRLKEFVGCWDDDVRQGIGKAVYSNGDILEGPFVNGQPHGNLKYTFAVSHKKRWAEYNHGKRVKWLENKSMDATKEVIGWLGRLRAQIKEEEEEEQFYQ